MSKKKKDKKSAVIDTSMFTTAEQALDESKENVFIPVGPAIDAKLKGGIPSGSLVLLRTLAKAGKSSLAMQIAANALRQGRYVIYADIERRLDPAKYFNVKGFDPKNPKFILIQAKQGEELISGDDIYTNIKNMMMTPKYRGALYVIDSFSKVIPKSTLEDDQIRADRRDTTPKLNADFCKKVGNLVRVSDSVVVGIQHFITDPNAMGDPLKADGGFKLEYECDIVLESRRKAVGLDGQPINLNKGESLSGILMRLNIPYNRRGAPYISKECPVMSYIKFGEGIWWAREAVDLLVDIGLCYTKGAYYYFTMPDGTELKAQGAEKAVALVESQRDGFEKIIKDYFVSQYKVNYNFSPPADDEDEEQEE